MVAIKSRKNDARPGAELVFGIVGALGTDIQLVKRELKEALARVDYKAVDVKLSGRIKDVTDPAHLLESPAEKRVESYMAAGDSIRKRAGNSAAVALLGVNWIRRLRASTETRSKKQGGRPLVRSAFIFDSLKTPSEVDVLRTIYGDGFFLVGAFTGREDRKKALTQRIATSHNASERTAINESAAEILIVRDEKDPETKYGQNVRDTFALADVFVDATDSDKLARQVKRFIELLFGHQFLTPTHAESMMYYARGAALRSAEMGRQVGAAVSSKDGELLAVGTNEVPRFGGGQYCAVEDSNNFNQARDIERGGDASDQMKLQNLSEVIEKVRELGWLRDEVHEKDSGELLDLAAPAFAGTRMMNAIEFGRALHAEMAAISEAARRGISFAEAILYTTTFPCHNCTRHIIGVGIKSVVYIEPYAKSLAYHFHDDAIVIEPTRSVAHNARSVTFEPFLGVAPTLYSRLFAMIKRKTAGKPSEWNPSEAESRLVPAVATYFEREDAMLATIHHLNLSTDPVHNGD